MEATKWEEEISGLLCPTKPLTNTSVMFANWETHSEFFSKTQVRPKGPWCSHCGTCPNCGQRVRMFSLSLCSYFLQRNSCAWPFGYQLSRTRTGRSLKDLGSSWKSWGSASYGLLKLSWRFYARVQTREQSTWPKTQPLVTWPPSGLSIPLFLLRQSWHGNCPKLLIKAPSLSGRLSTMPLHSGQICCGKLTSVLQS